VLVLEDLDSLVSPENRSFFLNQLDGFEQNHGLIVLATTNHADRIDAAIIDRPSRFDRKYHFTLPTSAERQVYLAGWQNRLLQETQWEANDVAEIAVATEGFSFAYLKELIISSVLSWIQDESAPFRDVLNRQAKFLASQMETEPIAKPVARKRKRATG
jgi:ATP-dependent 26S proteasome regulatory subunit